jgi:hypothetical protein
MTCPTNPEHGKVYDLSPNNWYCPHKAHEGHSRSFFTDDEVFAGHELRRTAPAPVRRTRRARK